MCLFILIYVKTTGCSYFMPVDQSDWIACQWSCYTVFVLTGRRM